MKYFGYVFIVLNSVLAGVNIATGRYDLLPLNVLGFLGAGITAGLSK